MQRKTAFTLAYALLIVALSSIPGKNFPSAPIFSQDKMIHLLEYAGFAFLLAWSRPAVASLWHVAIFASLFGAADEFYQSWVPGRDSSVMDWLADSVGVIIGVSALQLWKRMK